MNLISIQNKLMCSKWMLEKSTLYNLYNVVGNLGNIRVGGLRGMIFGNPPIIGKQQLSTDEIRAANAANQQGNTSIISISGILTKGASEAESELLGLQDTDEISNALDDAANDPSVNCIILAFNSPGGETCGIAEIGRKIKAIDAVTPVYAWTETHMASAAAWLGTQARYIGMTETAQIGSCGVYMLIPDASQKYKQEGINIQAISSGKWKMMGHDIKPLSTEEESFLLSDVEKQHKAFKEVVKANRPEIKDEALEGLSYEGPDALANGWVDCIAEDFDEFLEEINK